MLRLKRRSSEPDGPRHQDLKPLIAQNLTALATSVCSDATLHNLRCPKLTSLLLTNASSVRFAEPLPAECFPNLTCVHLIVLPAIRANGVLSLIASLPRLQRFFLNCANSNVCDTKLLSALATLKLQHLTHFAFLARLDTPADAEAVIALVRSCPSLIKLVLTQATFRDDTIRRAIFAGCAEATKRGLEIGAGTDVQTADGLLKPPVWPVDSWSARLHAAISRVIAAHPTASLDEVELLCQHACTTFVADDADDSELLI